MDGPVWDSEEYTWDDSRLTWNGATVTPWNEIEYDETVWLEVVK